MLASYVIILATDKRIALPYAERKGTEDSTTEVREWAKKLRQFHCLYEGLPSSPSLDFGYISAHTCFLSDSEKLHGNKFYTSHAPVQGIMEPKSTED
jgi:hypothetical protein